MAQRIMVNPRTGQPEIVEVLQSGGKPVSIVFSTHSVDNKREVDMLIMKSEDFNRTTNSRGKIG